MKCWIISDTHNRHQLLRVPSGIDVVIHCGDEASSRRELANASESRVFFEWYASLKIPTKIFVPGNHSLAIEQGLVRPEHYPNIRFLIHEKTDLDGLVVFGTPYTPEFFDWAYMKPRDELDPVWDSIPNNVDLLISHGPPGGVLDLTRDHETRLPIHVGSESLMQQVSHRIKPMLHAFGHIHDEPGFRNFGIVQHSGITFANCSCSVNRNKSMNPGIVLEIDPIRQVVSCSSPVIGCSSQANDLEFRHNPHPSRD